MQTVVDANPGLVLTRQEAGQYGELLIAAKQYAKAIDVFNALLAHAAANDQLSQADAYYGLGAAYLAQGDAATAKTDFLHIAPWHPHILDAQYGIALADEQSSNPDDNAAAKQIYASLMQAPQADTDQQAKAMLGYGRVLEKAGNAVNPTSIGPNDVAVHYYQQVDVLFGPAVPELSAEGLFDAGQAYAKAGNTAQAQAMYKKLIDGYAKTAPDWVAKAQAELSKLGP
jgi:tetratricopeptide (TPR) repeat protein